MSLPTKSQMEAMRAEQRDSWAECERERRNAVAVALPPPASESAWRQANAALEAAWARHQAADAAIKDAYRQLDAAGLKDFPSND